jgi:hypothetical protein
MLSLCKILTYEPLEGLKRLPSLFNLGEAEALALLPAEERYRSSSNANEFLNSVFTAGSFL